MPIEAYFRSLQQLLPDAPLDFGKISSAYADRPYHNLGHLDEMLHHLDIHGSDRINDPAIFALALIFHDKVYKPLRKDNEARSAESAGKILKRTPSVSPVRNARCQQLIMATKNHLPGHDDDGDEALLIDLDLAVLAREADDYDRYVADVRREFWMVPGFTFREGRVKALRSFLDRPYLYHTALGRERYETPARANLEREIEQY